jgi:FkbM family methyltransferase
MLGSIYVGNGNVLVFNPYRKLYEDNSRLYLNANDLRITPDIINEQYENFWTTFVYGKLKETDLFIDCGANIGWYTVLALSKVKKVIAIEPVRQSYNRLMMNVETNSVKNRVKDKFQLYTTVAADTKGQRMTFWADKNFPVGSHIVDYGSHPEENEGELIEVETITIDSIIGKINHGDLPQSFAIKIDVEGAELKVLEGMKRILKQFNDVRLFIEYDKEKENLITSFLSENELDCNFYNYGGTIEEDEFMPKRIYAYR